MEHSEYLDKIIPDVKNNGIVFIDRLVDDNPCNNCDVWMHPEACEVCRMFNE